MKQKKLSKNYTAPALEKGLDILELLSINENGLTQAEIASKLNKSVNEIYRMVSTLRSREYVDFDQDADLYRLSYKILNKLRIIIKNHSKNELLTPFFLIVVIHFLKKRLNGG